MKRRVFKCDHLIGDKVRIITSDISTIPATRQEFELDISSMNPGDTIEIVRYQPNDSGGSK